MHFYSGLLRQLRVRFLVTAIATFVLIAPAATGATEDPKPFAPAASASKPNW